MKLFIFTRKGFYQLTICPKCKYKWQCDNCSTNLVAYKSRHQKGILDLLCHQCQTTYTYPSICPECKNDKILSIYGAIDDLEAQIKDNYKEKNYNVIRLDQEKSAFKFNLISNLNKNSDNIFLSTRLYDPTIKYHLFKEIVFIQAENLLANPDYSTQEEVIKSITEIFLHLIKNPNNSTVIFDTKTDDSIFHTLGELIGELENNNQSLDLESIVKNWYENILNEENSIRQTLAFPPFINIILFTSHEKKQTKAKEQLLKLHSYLETILELYPEISFTKPYEAKLIKRRGYYSYHLMLRFPRNYSKMIQFKQEIVKAISGYHLQVRLNPRHLF
jgi:primosomal protein N' (replication factor Y) (superfamily II helicase)